MVQNIKALFWNSFSQADIKLHRLKLVLKTPSFFLLLPPPFSESWRVTYICSIIHSTGLLFFCVVTAKGGPRGQKIWNTVLFQLIRKALLLSTMRTTGVWQRVEQDVVLWMGRTQTSIARISGKKIISLACSVFKSRFHGHVRSSFIAGKLFVLPSLDVKIIGFFPHWFFFFSYYVSRYYNIIRKYKST